MIRLALLWALLCCAGAQAETRRFAVVVGNNAGTGAQPKLRYAEADAVKVARVLRELGDVGESDLFLLRGMGVGELEAAVRSVREGIALAHRQPDTRAVVLFYFSGHGDGEALELGTERLTYPTLRALLSGTGADLKVAIIDACRSGAAVQEKGGSPAPAFAIRLSDQLTARGEIFITSSSAQENSLESLEVGGGYFTHNLVSGLRGAADLSGDRLVTLSEAYRYAYARTVSATALTPAGAQHPAFDYQVSGHGELVLASLSRGASSLQLPDGAERAVVTDLALDQVVAELPPGGAREIAVGPGTYGVRLLREGRAYGGRFRIEEGARYLLRWDDVQPIASAKVAVKGGGQRPFAASFGARQDKAVLGVSLGAGAPVSEQAGLQGALRLSLEPSGRSGLSFALQLQTGAWPGAQVAESGAGVRVGYRAVASSGRLHFSVGAEAGAGYLRVEDGSLGGAQSHLGLVAGPRAAFRVRVGDQAWLGLEGELPLTVVNERAGPRAALTPAVVLGMALEL